MTQESSSANPQFSKLRSIFFPVHVYELKKVLPMALIFFCILFIYTCTRNIKDSLVVTAQGSGAEALSYLKMFCVPPAAIVFMLVYTKASNLLSNENLFYFTLTPFIVFFGAFAFLLYPIRDALHPSWETIQNLQQQFPSLKWFFSIYGCWSYSLFYILSELWGSALISLSFWQFANQITKTAEAKRFYSFFGLIAQTSLLFSGYLGAYFSGLEQGTDSAVDVWEISLRWQMGIVVLLGIVILFTFRWIYKHVLTDTRFYDKPELPGVPKSKKKTSIWQSLKDILTSPYLLGIALLIICYGISVNLIEAQWKSILKEASKSNPAKFNVFMNEYSYWTGIVAIVVLIIGGNILRIFSWFTAAIITPLIMFIGGVAFFALIIFGEAFSGLIDYFGSTPIAAGVYTGLVIVVLIKATKYALFDLTKEMAYIPLDEEMKVKGKAVVEVVGGRLGKSGGAGIQAFLLSVVFPGSSLITLAPYTAVIFVIVCVIWVGAVKSLSSRVEAARIQAKDSA